MSDSFVTPWTVACQAPLSFSISWSLLRFVSTESVVLSNHLILCHPFSFAFSLSQHQGLFQCMGTQYQVAKVLELQHSPSNECSGLISFRIDWFDLFSVQGTLKSHLQHHSSKAPILQCSAFFMVQLSHPFMTTGKTIALTRRTSITSWQSGFSAF